MALSKLKLYLYNTVLFLLGVLFTIAILFFLVASTPVYIYRICLVFAKKVFRPDLDSIVGGISACLVDDLLTVSVSRCNIIATFVFHGQFSADELKSLIMQKWFLPNSINLKKLRQRPVKWMGFYFWKSLESSFSIDNHVLSISEKDVSVDTDQLNKNLEQLSNTNLPLDQSPWQIFVIENYRTSGKNHQSSCKKSVMVVKWHHCLADAVAMKQAFSELFSCFPDDNTPPRGSIYKSMWYILLFPLQLLVQLPYLLTHMFQSTAFKLVNNKQERYQLYARTKPIPVQTIKKIKNANGVSFASVLLSGISSAFSKHLLSESFTKSDPVSGVCFTVLPVPIFSRPSGLSNHVTGILVDLHFRDNNLILPVERLKMVHQRLKLEAESYIAVGGFLFFTLVGWHLHYISKYLVNQNLYSSMFTSLTGQPYTKLEYKNLELVEEHGAAGALPGNAGMVLVVVSHDQEVSVQVCVDKSLMSPKTAQKFVDYIYEEIQTLEELVTT